MSKQDIVEELEEAKERLREVEGRLDQALTLLFPDSSPHERYCYAEGLREIRAIV